MAKIPAATDKSQESLECSDSESWSSHQKVVTEKLGSRKWPHNFHMSPASVPHMSTRSYERVMAEVQQMN